MRTILALPLAPALWAPADSARSDTAAPAGPVAEIVTFRLQDGITPAAFLAAARTTEPFLRAAPGFGARRLTEGADGQWTDYIEWHSLDQAQAAATAIMARPEVTPFLQAIDPTSVRMRHDPLVWSMD